MIYPEKGTTYLRRFVIKNELGRGSYSRVFKAFDLKDKIMVAIKIAEGDGYLKKRNLAEFEHLKKLNSTNSLYANRVIKLKTSFEMENCVILVLELISDNLKNIINKGLMDSPAKLSFYAKQMIEFLCYMDEMNIIHGDIKPDNILVDESNNSLKFIDFGFSQSSNETIKLIKIQFLNYRSPEVLLGYGYTTTVDTWSIACVLIECLLKTPIFKVTNELELMTAIVQIIGPPNQEMIEKAPKRDQFFKFDQQGKWVVNGTDIKTAPYGLKNYVKRFGIKDNNDLDNFIDLLEKMLKINPNERLSVKSCLEHPFIRTSPAIFIPENISLGSKLSSSSKNSINTFESTDLALKQLSKVCSQLKIKKELEKEAKVLFRQIENHDILKKQTKSVVMMCCLLTECHKRRMVLSYENLSSVSGIDTSVLGRVHRMIRNLLNEPLKQVNAKPLI